MPIIRTDKGLFLINEDNMEGRNEGIQNNTMLFFLMAALCGCTTQSIEDAKAIEETKSYAYRYEYETDSAGEAVTKIYNEKPTYDENEQVEEYQQGPLSNKTSMMKFIKMNETFEYYDCEFTVKRSGGYTKL